MARLRILISLPNDNAYQHEQATVAKSAAANLGMDLQLLNAGDDSITQSQQLLGIVQSSSSPLPDAILVEPVTATGLPRVAEAAVKKGIAWVISNTDVDYLLQLRKNTRVPLFTVTQGQNEIGQLQGKQLAALLPSGGSVLYLEGPTMSAVSVQRRQGLHCTVPRNVVLTTLRSKWSSEAGYQSVAAWLRLATSRAERFHLVAGQTHELALGAQKAFLNIGDELQRKHWGTLPFIGIGVESQVKSLVQNRVLTAAVVSSLTMGLALKILARALESGQQAPERTVADSSSLPELSRLSAN